MSNYRNKLELGTNISKTFSKFQITEIYSSYIPLSLSLATLLEVVLVLD